MIFNSGLRRLATGMLLVASCASLTMADSVKLGGMWIPDVHVQTVTKDGQLVYTTSAGGEVTQPLEDVEGLKIDAYPALGEAQEAMANKNHAAAVTALLSLRGKVREPWLQPWVLSMLASELDQTGHAVQAVEAYLALAKTNPQAFFLKKPPVQSLSTVSAGLKGDLERRIKESRLQGAAAEGAQAMLEALGKAGAGQAEAAPAAPAAASPAAAAPARAAATPAPAAEPAVSPAAPAAPVAPAAPANEPAAAASSEPSAWPLPKTMDGNDPVTQLLRKGQFQEALTQTDKILAGPTRELSMRLYQRGVAQLGLAEASKDQKLYKDAGLSFMRVVIYFPKSQFAGPSLMEAGYVHQVIGRPDQANRLLDKAGILIDPEQDPALAARLEQLKSAHAAK